MNRKSLIIGKGTKILLLLTTYCLLLSTAHSYSLFSGAGLGEPVDRPFLFEFELPEDLTFESSLLSEIIDADGKATNFEFTLPHFRFVLPLPKKLAIDVGLDELLNLNFDIQSDTIWEDLAQDSVQRRVKGKGSASTFKIGLGKRFEPLIIELGGFIIFGSAQEEWITDFMSANDACDTVDLKFSGAGGLGFMKFELGKFNLAGGYFSNSKLTSEKELPSRFNVSAIYTPIPKIRLGVGVARWNWEGEPFEPMLNFSVGSELDISRGSSQSPITLRGGFYTGNWYYDGIEERKGSLGITIPFKSMLKIDLSFEFGKRWNSTFEEKIYRTCITLQGQEVL